jgi:hypothetical protein
LMWSGGLRRDLVGEAGKGEEEEEDGVVGALGRKAAGCSNLLTIGQRRRTRSARPGGESERKSECRMTEREQKGRGYKATEYLPL